MTGSIRIFPFRVVAFDQIDQIFFGFDMGKAYEIIDVSFADLAFIFH